LAVIADLVAARFVVRFHRLAGDGIDQLVLKAVPRAAVHLPEGNRSAAVVAGYSATGQDTNESLRKPLQ
jgi:hypothetical protein